MVINSEKSAKQYGRKSKVKRAPKIMIPVIRVSKFAVENVFNNSHIEYNNECDNNNNINDNEILKKKFFSS